MSTEKMTDDQIEIVCNLLHYIPTRNVVGLRNGTACFLFDNWAPNSVCAHSFIGYPGDLTRGFLRDTFRYVFSNVDWLIGVTPGDNVKALAFNKRIGFKETYRLMFGFDKTVDQVYQTMWHEDCKYWRRTQ